MKEEIKLKYFSKEELHCPSTKVVKLQPKNSDEEYIGFGERIDELRERWGKPLIVNSCCRSKAYNAKLKDASPNSFHVYDSPHYAYLGQLGTLAIDFREHSEEFRNLAWSMGFSLGLGRNFTHCDDRKLALGLPQRRFNY